jgi:hypothetical protein
MDGNSRFWARFAVGKRQRGKSRQTPHASKAR